MANPSGPSAPALPRLHLLNSLTRSKEPFYPAEGNTVKWYSCGPTVYTNSHMGHARSYITFDILRRVLQDYFHYDVEYVMNITDLDDKIILQARRSHLFEQYKASKPTDAVVRSDIKEASDLLREKLKGMIPEKVAMYETILEGSDAALANANSTVEVLLAAAQEPLGQLLDNRHGATVSDQSIFTKMARHWENEYHKDMKSLNVRAPDVLTRVTEYVPEIVAYIEKIISNGFAYASNGSVYFQTSAFAGHEDHSYGKLVPEAVGDMSALNEGEGELSKGSSEEKKSSSDFALWKASKPGEPSWDSPWGKGRPGWHIECSVMACDVCGPVLDIHTGGVDLKFPHHDNELAQAEAHYGSKQWVNYFLHSGHLKIAGMKMARSLKNFITIEQALASNTARQMRLVFLTHSWHTTLDYSEESMSHAVSLEQALLEFFLNIKADLQTLIIEEPADGFVKWGTAEHSLSKDLFATKEAVHAALCDNINTPAVMQELRGLVGKINLYRAKAEKEKRQLNISLLSQAAAFVHIILDMFGCIEEDDSDFGFGTGSAQNVMDKAILPEVLKFAQVRSQIRAAANKKNKTVTDKAVLALCDHVRDVALPELGIRLEDKESGSAIKLVDAEILKFKRERELAAKAAKEADRAAKQLKQQAEKRAKMMLGKCPPNEVFRTDKKYANYKFDDQGMPVADAEGTEVAKSMRKKLDKLYKKQEKLHAQYLDWVAKEGTSTAVGDGAAAAAAAAAAKKQPAAGPAK